MTDIWKFYQNISLFFAFFILIFSNDENFGAISQYISLIFIVASTFIGVFSGKIKKSPLTLFEYSIMFVVVLSLLTSIFAETTYFFTYTIIFGIVCICFSLISRQFSVENLIIIIAKSYILSVIVILLFNWQDFKDAFDLSNNRWEVRFRPFGFHPNLVGFVYGAGTIILLFCGLLRSGFERLVYYIFSFFCVLFIFAGQARAGLVALFFGIIISSIISLRFWTKKAKLLVFWGVTILIALIAINFTSFYGGMAEMLDLESDTRGIDSGGTGRVELWGLGIETIINGGWKFFIGGGMRSASVEFIGFSTESSYITIFLEFGLVGGLIFLFGLAYNIYFIALNLKISKNNNFTLLFLILSVIFFTIIQSIFNRYLLAIGNQFSLFFLLVNFKMAILAQSCKK